MGRSGKMSLLYRSVGRPVPGPRPVPRSPPAVPPPFGSRSFGLAAALPCPAWSALPAERGLAGFGVAGPPATAASPSPRPTGDRRERCRALARWPAGRPGRWARPHPAAPRSVWPPRARCAPARAGRSTGRPKTRVCSRPEPGADGREAGLPAMNCLPRLKLRARTRFSAIYGASAALGHHLRQDDARLRQRGRWVCNSSGGDHFPRACHGLGRPAPWALS